MLHVKASLGIGFLMNNPFIPFSICSVGRPMIQLAQAPDSIKDGMNKQPSYPCSNGKGLITMNITFLFLGTILPYIHATILLCTTILAMHVKFDYQIST